MKLKARLSGRLQGLLTAKGLTDREAAEIFGQFHSVVNLVRNGARTFSKANMAAFLDALAAHPEKISLDPAEAVPLGAVFIEDWLKDMVPEKWEHTIEIRAKQRPSAETEANVDPLADALRYFEKKGRQHPEIADWLISTKALMQEPENMGIRLAAAKVWREGQSKDPDPPESPAA